MSAGDDTPRRGGPSGDGARSPLAVEDADPHRERVLRVLERVPLIDGHNDLPWAVREHTGAAGDVSAYDLAGRAPGHTDIPRLRAGRVGGQFLSAFVPCEMRHHGAARIQREQIALARALVAAHPHDLALVETADGLVEAFEAGRIGMILALEGGHVIEGSLDRLREFFDLGARSLTLTHNCNTDWADSATDAEVHGGLSDFGVEVVREMNRLGMIVDLSHTSPDTMHDALDATEAPVLWTHAGCMSVVDHPRNVPDPVLERVPANGGVVMVTFVPAFVSVWHDMWDEQETSVRADLVRRWGAEHGMVRAGLQTWRVENYMPPATLPDVADHLDHVRQVCGEDHVGIGSDFDGTSRVVEGLEDVSTFPDLLVELSRRGWSEEALEKVAGRNVLRVMRAVEERAEG